MNNPLNLKKRTKRRRPASSSSTAEHYEEGPPPTSGHGHRAGGKLKKETWRDDSGFSFRDDAPDSLAHLEDKFLSRLQTIQTKSKLLKGNNQPNKKHDKKQKKEEPLDIARREQSGSCIYLFESQFDRDESKDEVDEQPNSSIQARRRDLPDKSTNNSKTHSGGKIPKKSVSKVVGLKKDEEKASSGLGKQRSKIPSSYSIDLSSDDKISHNQRHQPRQSVKSTTIDLCSDGETDSEDINWGSNPLHRNKLDETIPRKSRDVNKSAKCDDTFVDKTKNAEKKIAQTIAAIENDDPFVPQALTLSKVLSSSEGRKIKNVPVKTIAAKIARPMVDLVKSFSSRGKKNWNAPQPIVPGATLGSNKTQGRNGAPQQWKDKRTTSGASLESKETHTKNDGSLESNDTRTNGVSMEVEKTQSINDASLGSINTRTTGGASLESTKTLFASVASTPTPNKRLFSNDSSDDSYTSPSKSRSSDKSATKSTDKIQRKNDRDFLGSHYNTRSSARKTSSEHLKFDKRKKPVIVDMLDDSDDEQNTLACFDIARIALGSSVKHQNCQIKVFNDGILSYSYSFRSKDRVHNIDFTAGDVKEVRYYIDDTIDEDGNFLKGNTDVEPGSFIALIAEKTKSNGFSSVNSYVPGDLNEEKSFIVAEFRSDADIATFMSVVQENPLLSPFFSNKNRLAPHLVHLYSKALVADAKKEVLNRNKRVRTSERIGFLTGKENGDILLRFPFGEDTRLVDAAAEGLSEFQGPRCIDTNEETRGFNVDEHGSSEPCALEGSGDSRRGHHLEIRVEDFERLDPGVYLNDTLIDFFLQWMTRKHTLQDLHVFTTHFYTSLEDNGAEGVSNWTTKKKIDVFKLKFIYVPINKALHWSFCVVVNPGHILNHLDRETRSSFDDDDPMPCLLFFDSLKMHQKDRVHRNVINWLNAEWVRLGKPLADEMPFDKSSLPVVAPKVTYQNNSWDCGVFVCRYASGMFQLRHRVFSYNEVLGGKKDVIKMITHGDAFNFSLDDIAGIREQMKTLIERLSAMYIPWRAKMDREERLEKLAIESKEQSGANGSPQEGGNGVQSLTTPTSSTAERPDITSYVYGDENQDGSRKSLATQNDYPNTNENVESDFTGSKDSVQQMIDRSPWLCHHTGGPPRSTESSDAVSV